MILTVTPNTALDRVLFIEEWTPGTPMRTTEVVTSVGGKGLDSSVVLRCLGVETVGLAFVAGETGKTLLREVERYGIVADPIWVKGETRLAHVIVERKHDRHSHLIAGELLIEPAHEEAFLQRYRARLKEADWVICAGSLPPSLEPSFYRRLVEEASPAGVPVLIDSARAAVLEAIPARPAILKMNREEFEWTFEMKLPGLAALAGEAKRLRRRLELPALVITCSAEGILAFGPQGDYHATAPRCKPVNAAGAGDAVSSALAWRLSEGEDWPTALRWAAAAAAAVVLTQGTAVCSREEVLRILPEARVAEI